MKLNELKIGEYGIIKELNQEDRSHLLDMGLTPNTVVKLVKTAPLGDPIQITLRGYELSLRLSDAKEIVIEKTEACDIKKEVRIPNQSLHPRMGEGFKDLKRFNANYKMGLIGNQNCGKTTLFNQLTGSNQHVGNFPGVTVDRKDGQIKGFNAVITDLPGIYSLSPYSSEEIITREFLINEKPDLIVNIVDATNIERNLYLTTQLLELDIPMVIALNMMDELSGNGGHVSVNILEEELGVPVVPISAAKNMGISELIDHMIYTAGMKLTPKNHDFCDKNGLKADQALHRAIHAVGHAIDDHAVSSGISRRFAATRLILGDKLIEKSLNLDENEIETIDHIKVQLVEETGIEEDILLANMRYNFIEKVCNLAVIKPHESLEHQRSQRIDKILTGKHTALISFILIMALIFYLSFGLIGPFLADGFEYLLSTFGESIRKLMEGNDMNPHFTSLVVDGVISGVSSVLVFLPTIAVLFLFLSILEDSGYMARIAFIMDRPLRKLGLSGRSFVPMLIGFGCSVPAILATRTLASEKDRKVTILLTPFMSCTAKLPVYSLIVTTFFDGLTAVLIIILLYLLGIISGIIYAFILNKTKYKGDAIPFVMELPNYRLPSRKNTLMLLWDKCKDFITRAFTIIFAASIVLWFMSNFDLRFNIVADQNLSILASVGTVISVIFAPLGLADYRIVASLITGFVAKESVVSTLTVLVGSNLTSLFTTTDAIVFLVFTLLYTPCVASIAAVKREFNSTFKAVMFALNQCFIAYLVALLFKIIFMIL